MEMNELLQLPDIQEALRIRDESRAATEREARSDVIDEMEALDRERDVLRNTLKDRITDLETARHAVAEETRKVAEIGSALASLRKVRTAMDRVLRSHHGEQVILDASNRLVSLVLSLEESVERLEQAKYRLVPVMGGLFQKKEVDSNVVAKLGSIVARLDLARLAVNKVERLRYVRQAPSEIAAEIQTLLTPFATAESGVSPGTQPGGHWPERASAQALGLA